MPSYSPPGVTLTAQGNQTLLLAGATPITVRCVGTASKGPDFPVVISPQQAAGLFGDPYASASVGYTLPLGMLFLNAQRQPVGNGAIQFQVCRVGVTRATVNVLDAAAGIVMTLSGIGVFAGSAANGVLQALITAPQFVFTRTTPGTVSTPEVQKVQFINTPTGGTFTVSVKNVSTGAVGVSGAVTYSVTPATLVTNLNAGLVTALAAAGIAATVTSASLGAAAYSLTWSVNGAQNLPTAPVAGQLLTGQSSAPPVTEVDIQTNTGAIIQQFTSALYDLSTAAKIIAAINGANNPANITSVVIAAPGASSLLPKNQTVTLTGGADGLGTAYNDASVNTALTNSLNFPADFVWAAYDASQITATISSHINSAVALNQFPVAVLGPAFGTTFGTLSGGTYQAANSSRIVIVGHDGAYANNPVNGQSTIYDGWYLAAAYCGLKAVGPTSETGTGFAITGFTQLAIPSDKTGPLSTSDKNTLAGNGYLVFENPAGSSALIVRDAITTAPYSVNNAVNPFTQLNVQKIDDAVSSALIAAVSPFKGRPSLSLSVQLNQLQNACQTALGRLGSIINGVNSVVVTFDPMTLIPTINVSYITRYPILQIAIVTSYTFI